MKKIRIFFFQFLIFILLIEIFSFIGTKFSIFLVNDTPFIYSNNKYKDIGFGRTEKDSWGPWHIPNETFIHKKNKCFNVKMTFNEIGARDTTIKNFDEKSLILLGDSFAEGWGVEFEETSQFNIEKNLNTNILNLGTAAEFGPLSALLLYKNFNNIKHKGLIVYIFPANDFTDNDKNFWINKRTKRYRPLFSDDVDTIEPFYEKDAVKRENFYETNTFKGKVKYQFKKYLWSSNVIRSFLLIYQNKTVKKINDEASLIKSYYYDSDYIQQKNLIKAYKEIKNISNEKEILFVIIPAKADILRYKQDKKPNSYKNQFWYKELVKFNQMDKQKVLVLDLLNFFTEENSKKYFFNCDAHWNKEGNKYAADVISKFIISNNLFIH